MNPFINKTYAQSISYLAETYCEKIALVFQDRNFSFAQIKQEADIASSRLADLGVKPGETVGLWLTNLPEFAWLWFGAAQMGAIPVILNNRLRRAEFEYQMKQSQCVAVFLPGPGAFRDFLEELVEVCPAIRKGSLPAEPFPDLRKVVVLGKRAKNCDNVIEWEALGNDHPVPQFNDDPDSPALIAYSSGTTSLPKGAMLSHCIWRKAYDGSTYLNVESEDSLYLCVPLFGVLGFLNGLLTFWSRGCRIILRERFDATDFIATIRDEKCSFALILPTMIDQIKEHPDYSKTAFSTLRGGVLLSSQAEHMKGAISVFDARGFTTGYGLTETTGLVSRSRCDSPLEARLSHQGWPLPGCPIRIVDLESGEDLAPGKEGEILIGGYSIMLGYYNKPEETAQSITKDGWLRSGDLGHQNTDGSIKFLRRIKDGYKHNGFNVSTLEVEAAVMKFPGVAAAAVVGIPDKAHGETGVAFIIPKDETSPEPKELLNFLKSQIASFKIPAAVFITDKFPLTAGTDKVRKFKLRDLAMEKLGIET